MDVRCERCRAQYVFDDEQVTHAGLTVRCTSCGHLFRVKKKELVVTVPVRPDEVGDEPVPATALGPRPAGQAAPEAARGWQLRRAGGDLLAFRELTTLQKWVVERKVGRDDELSQPGGAWRRLGDLPELASFFEVVEAAERGRKLTPPAFAPPPPPSPSPSPLPRAGPLPPPPSGYPPPAFAMPLPSAAPVPAAAAPSPPAEAPRPPAAPAPVPVPVPEDEEVLAPVDVDLGAEVDLAPEERAEQAIRRNGRRRTRLALATLAVAVVAAAAAWVLVPRRLGRERTEPPLVLEGKPAEPPAPPPAAEPPAPPPPPPAVVEPPAPRPVKTLLAEAARLRERGEIEKALDVYGSIAGEDPDNVEALTGRGLCYLDLESYPPAEASFQAALEIDPRDADALLGLAETYRWQGKKADAIRYYDRYLAAHPGGDEAQVARNALEELRK